MEARTKMFMAAALAGMALAGTINGGTLTEENGKCYGVNACKGKGECATKDHACAGMNSCKGKGWISLTKKECEAKGGTFEVGAGM
ncbi:MAG: hypothetical protein K8S54_12465 [Spirochaetia bacterium]|nr:hypothetical protein [Spirochaetia bacterium]